jgi:AraC-like DNA-binding protein
LFASMQTTLRLDQPDLIAPERTRRMAFGDGSERITILNARGRLWDGGGDEPDLSLKWIPDGAAHYTSERAHFDLSGNAQLLLNRGQPYRLHMKEVSESFVVFFSRELADRAWQALTGSGEAMPEAPSVAGLSQDELRRDLATLRAAARRDAVDPARLEEMAFAVLSGVAALARTRRRMRDAVPALRGATRGELLRRLARAEAYLIEEQNGASLEGAADAAALSPFHLIRMFRGVYGATPLAFAAGKRLDSARDALLMTDDPIAAIAERAGYATRNAFDRAFVRRFKTTPGAMRLRA